MRPEFIGKFYNWRKINSYNLPINVVISHRGLGKTFGAKFKAISDFIFKGQRFNYIVENLEMVKELTKNRGEKFFSRIIEYCRDYKSVKNDRILSELTGSYLSDGDEEKGARSTIRGGTIFIGGQTAGYVLALTDFGNLKRNDFVNVHTNIIDEFISEKTDITTFQNPYRMASLIHSIVRMETNTKIVMCSNTVNINDPVLVKLGLDKLKLGEWRKLKIDGKVVGIAHRVDKKDYPTHDKDFKKSVSGYFAHLLGETDLHENVYHNELGKDLSIPRPQKSSWFFACFHGELGSIRLQQTKDKKEFYVYPDYGDNQTGRFCLDRRFVSPNVRFLPEWKDLFTRHYYRGVVYFESSNVHTIFKNILGLK